MSRVDFTSFLQNLKKPTVSSETTQASPQENHRCVRCGGYVDCDDSSQDRFDRMQAEQVMPQASYPQLACPYCEEVH